MKINKVSDLTETIKNYEKIYFAVAEYLGYDDEYSDYAVEGISLKNGSLWVAIKDIRTEKSSFKSINANDLFYYMKGQGTI